MAPKRGSTAKTQRPRSYYLVLAGELLVHRHPARTTAGRPKAAVRIVTSGDLFIFDCDGVHVADCDAAVDSVVLRIDRRRFERQADLDPVLRGLRNAVHADVQAIMVGHDGPGMWASCEVCRRLVP